MSNYLAIATVTATLQRILQSALQIDVAGARVTTVRPDASGSGTPEVGVNVFMYQVLPNPAWRNSDLRNRRPKGELSKQAQAGIDLYYLMTFYGNEVELEPQRLLGCTLRTLVDQPILTPTMLRDTINNPTFSYLAGSTLAEQVEQVTLVPTPMNTEELSKIWSVFFQTPYVLSFAYQGSTILIEGSKPGKRALPLRSSQFFVTSKQPVIKDIESDDGINQPIGLDSTVTITGKQLRSSHPRILAKVRIGDAQITPQEVSDTQVKVDLSQIAESEKRLLRAGVQSLQVLHPLPTQVASDSDLTTADLERAVGSNVLPVVVYPTIVDVSSTNTRSNGDELYSAIATVQVDVMVAPEQRAYLLLNERVLRNPAAYVFGARSRSESQNTLTFIVHEVKAGTYLVRVQIDNAESKLTVDPDDESPTFDQYTEPTIEIRST
ncbi:DUF4255 domain-containing protein [Cyanobacteria bacterium FACHB-471]|nr:DUF4255 domain-containing protein [Cyanobacteria bacterium FACHB-471]